jgi:hypothetical protein
MHEKEKGTRKGLSQAHSLKTHHMGSIADDQSCDLKHWKGCPSNVG